MRRIKTRKFVSTRSRLPNERDFQREQLRIRPELRSLVPLRLHVH
jgi:hypothetical protein